MFILSSPLPLCSHCLLCLTQFLADTFNALFAIMEEKVDTVGDLVFEALVSVCVCV